jgi:hypothetical protein
VLRVYVELAESGAEVGARPRTVSVSVQHSLLESVLAILKVSWL